MAASVSSNAWETVSEGALKVHESLLMSFLDDSQLEEVEDEQLRRLISSLQAEIDCRTDVELQVAGGCKVDVDAMAADDQDDGNCYGYISPIEDSFDWEDMDVCEMGGWYLDVDDVRLPELGQETAEGCSSFHYCGGRETAMGVLEQQYCPLWEEMDDCYRT